MAYREVLIVGVGAVALGAIHLGCSSAPGAAAGTGEEVRSTAARNEKPAVSPGDLVALTDGLGAFSIDLYQALRPTAGNFIVSPTGISAALSMAYAGAGTTTASQMAAALHYTLPVERLIASWDALELELPGGGNAASSSAFALSMTNAVWGQAGSMFVPTYLDLLAEYYGAGIRTVDFENSPATARAEINTWTSVQTDGRISNLLPAGAISAATRMILTNAVLFHGDWLAPFDPKKTTDSTFHALEGDVPMKLMSGGLAPLWAASGWAAADLSYASGDVSMLAVVPDAGTFAAFEAGLTWEELKMIIAEQSTSGGTLAMPRFNFGIAESLSQMLAGMGMSDAFDPAAADFSLIDGAHDLSLGDVVHQASVTVDEKGTTASAATAAGVVATGGAVPLHSLTIDRPFLFFVIHQPTGAILFAGRVTNPSN